MVRLIVAANVNLGQVKHKNYFFFFTRRPDGLIARSPGETAGNRPTPLSGPIQIEWKRRHVCIPMSRYLYIGFSELERTGQAGDSSETSNPARIKPPPTMPRNPITSPNTR